MLPYDPRSKEGNDTSLRFFYDISTSQIRAINLPETKGKQCCGSSQGWLVLQDGPEISLLNPFSGACMKLPALSVPPTISGASGFESEEIRSRLDIWPSRYGYEGDTDPIIQKIILTSSPLDPDCVVMALFKSNWGLAFCHIGDESWTLFEGPEQNNAGHRLIDATYHKHKGLIYCLYSDEVRGYDLKGKLNELLVQVIIPLEQADYYLMEGEFEEFRLVAKHQAPHGRYKWDRFSFYKLDIQCDELGWIKTRDIGERICFMSKGIEQCFTSPPTDNLQMPKFGVNLLWYACPRIRGRKRRVLGMASGDKFKYDIKRVKWLMVEGPNSLNHWKDCVIELVNSFGPYPVAYSQALWITPSFC